MEKTAIRKFKWFWAWQDEAEEAWLGKMSQEGWHLSSFRLPGIYSFTAGGPRDYVYRLDFRIQPKKDMEDYLQPFRDAGWEYVGEMSSWHYFRKEVRPGEVTEIFTDVESKVKKYKRLLIYLVIFLPIWSVLVGNVLSSHPYVWWSIVQMAVFLLLLLYVFVVFRILLRIGQLKRH